MFRVARFEKVSFDQFYKDMTKIIQETGGVYNDEGIRAMYDGIELPKRATSGSAGYDFHAPFGFSLAPGESIKIPTGIRAKIDEGWWLCCLPRSGLGFKYQVRLANTVGTVDADYYGSSNEGHIFLKIVNGGDKEISVRTGDGIVQGIFLPYGITYGDNANGIRDGGFGSTGR